MSKRQNPYNRLLDEIKSFVNFELKYAHRVFMFQMDGSGKESYPMHDVLERVKAAEQLGYEVILETDGDLVKVFYRRKPRIPWHFE